MNEFMDDLKRFHSKLAVNSTKDEVTKVLASQLFMYKTRTAASRVNNKQEADYIN
jgi:hypothetical protein